MEEKIKLLAICMRRAYALGYSEVEYTLSGFNLMKNDRVSRSFRSLEELDEFLRTAQERFVRLGRSFRSVINAR